jgi:hypothetical protein
MAIFSSFLYVYQRVTSIIIIPHPQSEASMGEWKAMASRALLSLVVAAVLASSGLIQRRELLKQKHSF